MQQLVGIGKIAAAVGGAAWTLKSGLIIAMNEHFQPIEGVLYFLGVGGILVGALGLAAYVAARASGAMRWFLFLVTLVVAVIVTAIASSFIQEAVADSYTGNNVGVEEEIGILTPGVIWLAIGVFLLIATRRRPTLPGDKVA